MSSSIETQTLVSERIFGSYGRQAGKSRIAREGALAMVLSGRSVAIVTMTDVERQVAWFEENLPEGATVEVKNIGNGVSSILLKPAA